MSLVRVAYTVSALMALGLSVASYAKSSQRRLFLGVQAGGVGITPGFRYEGFKGPYFSAGPMLDYGNLGIRVEAGTHRLVDTAGAWWSTFWAGYIRFPITMAVTKKKKDTAFTVSSDAFQMEFGAGMENWYGRSGGWQGTYHINLVLDFHSTLERFILGWTYFAIPGAATAFVKMGLGFAF